MGKTGNKLILFGIITLLTTRLCAQPVTLSGEIIWKEKDLFILNYDKAKAPFIRFTYKNNTGDSLYFYNELVDTSRFFKFEYEQPLISYVEGYFPPNRDDIMMKSFPDWSDKAFNVLIGKRRYNFIKNYLYQKNTKFSENNLEESYEHEILSGLTAILDMQSELEKKDTNFQYKYFHYPNKTVISDSTIQKETEYLINKVNQFPLSDEYKLLKLERDSMDKGLYPKKVSQRVYDLIEKDIFSKCVFLKPYQSFSVEFDLTPFFLLKGSYKFIVEPQKFKKSITFWNRYTNSKEYSLNDKRRISFRHNDNYFTYDLRKNHHGYKLLRSNINRMSIQLKIK